jgi:hypothetical protein
MLMSPVETDVERRLRTGLRAWQEEIAPAPADFPARLRERRRRQRQARATTVAALVAAAAVVPVAGTVARGVLVAPDSAPAVLAALPLQRGGVASAVPEGAAGVRVLDADGAPVAGQPLTEVVE